jgi:DNA-directed RNA polymerase subunit RPC12/RpoP
MERAYRRFERDTLPKIPTDHLGVHNVYVCHACATNTITVDRDKGPTTMALACPQCGKVAISSGYPRAASALEPTVEWYRPKLDEFQCLGPDLRAHVLNGGLLARPIAAEVDA